MLVLVLVLALALSSNRREHRDTFLLEIDVIAMQHVK